MKNYDIKVPITVEDDADIDKIAGVVDEMMTDRLDHNVSLGVVVTGDSETTFVSDLPNPERSTSIGPVD